MEKRIMLDSEDFELLIQGEIITKDGVKIALADIGWEFMIRIIQSNMYK